VKTVGEKVALVAKEFLGPAAPAFLRRELGTLGVDLGSMREQHLQVLVARAERAATRLMGPERAGDFVRALRACGGKAMAPDADTFRALARDAISRDDLDTAVAALRDGAATLVRSNDRVGALALLEQAVAVAPGDLTVHRRLGAAFVNRNDVAAACAEYARFIDLAVTRGDTRRAWLELTYAREMLGELPDLLAIADRLLPAAVASPAAADPVVASAARQLLGDGKVGAAADLLLDHIARGSTDREAQRVLLEISCALDRRDLARDKCHALATAYRLDGSPDAANDIERIAGML